jgi:anti-anti-sigma factor
MPDPLARIELESTDDRLRVSVHGEVDLSNSERIYKDIQRAISERQPREVTVELTNVDYLDSQGVYILLRVAGGLRDRHIKLHLVAPPESVAGRLLAISQVGSLGVEPRDEQPH